jgi:hypothetical protein
LTPGARDSLLKTIKQNSAESPDKSVFDKLCSGIKETSLLSQCLDGFNDALLMAKREFQLPVKDPQAPNDKDFALIREALGAMNDKAPQPINHFLPVRTGFIRLSRLRMVDAFGRIVDLIGENNDRSVIYTHSLKVQEKIEMIKTKKELSRFGGFMSPRLVHPLRLQFRYLGTGNENIELDSHSQQNPFLAWILPNFLDNSIMIHDGEGHPVGSMRLVKDKVRWQPVPGAAESGSFEAAKKRFPEIARFCDELIKNATYFESWMRSMDRSIQFMHPKNYREDKGIASFVGHPLVLIRACLKLELFGLPPLSQKWQAVIDDFINYSKDSTDDQQLKRYSADKTQLMKIEFPVRLGNLHDCEDGLAGFFRNDDYTRFFSPGASNKDGCSNNTDVSLTLKIKPHDASENKGEDDEIVTMLVDPRIPVHATSGILPVKSIQLPPHFYHSHLKNISVTLFTGPVLIDGQEEVKIPVSEESGKSWSYIEHISRGQDKESFKEYENVVPEPVNGSFKEKLRISEGWLKLIPGRGKNE